METLKNAWSKVFRQLQRLGPAMMPVIAIMPVAGLLYGIGVILTEPTIVGMLPFLGNPLFAKISSTLFSVGNLINSNFHILFAISIAASLCKNDAIAGMCGAISFLTLCKTLEAIGGITADMVATDWTLYANVFGINTLSMGVFGGILCGCVSAWLFNKFKDIKLPAAIAFFQGKRFVPIVVIAFTMVMAIPVYYLWPMVQNGITAFGAMIVGFDSAWWAPIVIVFALRVLLICGLHTLVFVPLAYQFGTWVNSAGEVFHGAYSIYFAQVADGAELTTYYFLSGNYIMVFCYLALGAAFIYTAKKERRKQTAAQIVPSMVTVGLTGISEPLEYSYLFNSLPTYLLHSFVMACLVMLAKFFEITVATGSWGGAVDLFLYGILQNNPTVWKLIPAGAIAFVVEFAIMVFAIKKFHLKTPGNDDVEVSDEAEVAAVSVGDDELPQKVLAALGGKENVADIDACATRLRVSAVDAKKVNQKELKALGAAGIVKVGDSLQIIFGAKAILLKEQIVAIMKGTKVDVKSIEAHIASNVEEEIAMPVNGELIPLNKVPDKVFAEGMLGCGFAVVPSDGNIVSPVNGTVYDVFEAQHAVTLITDGGKEVLIHMGINTVEMKGEPFEVLVKKDQIVSVGTPLAKMDLKKVKDSGRDTSICVVFTNAEGKNVVLSKSGNVKAKAEGLVKFVVKETV